MKSTVILAAASALAPLVSAHGYVSQAIVAGVTYPGWNPNVDPYLSPAPQRIFRKIPGNGPVIDLSLIDVQCNGYTDGGFATAPAALSANIAPGGTITVQWTQWPDSHKGPIITYMAKCPGSCTNYSPGTAKVWFKIQEAGKVNGVWATTPLETNPAAPFSFKIPTGLAPGNYIIRHELIALHAAYSYPGAQVYPSCFQVTVTGSGTRSPPSSSLVSFPGAYTGSTPGITYDMYTNTGAYPIPGPALWS
ncbi:Esterase/lipase/thioesterase [Orbilia oligospora]|uniref:lytic cellulose monooxygenase (C4-dehydrogenating) n=1 Tax=Orbilia oligospora TaxID=2813651 RepID=A0A7C8NKS8_ORBOL|nr:Esterase/lipase/thioesterase [Orbilia oligospora]KAF3114475.1 Esterase/lipase/thioesterase [Orbilia oligospora]KAF3114730.1 Esterase/lipase/thioesterase [Orbilia oligospora]KAF3122015.1 Esterase/lipase/thioesterase [Orbilia oligospora]KAF3132258.1 Esterase/lipase/thioesterase [Orbilia oligospora]